MRILSGMIAAAMLTGCMTTANGNGGDAPSLANSEWRIESIAGTPVVEGGRATLAFTEDRISGSAGCNRLSGPYRVEDGRLIAGTLAVTRMACPGPQMEQENRAFKLLEQPLAIESSGTNGIALTAPNGQAIVLRRM